MFLPVKHGSVILRTGWQGDDHDYGPLIFAMAKTILINSSYAPSLINFRGPLISEMVRRGHKVYATAPDIDPAIMARLERLGACAHTVPLSRAGLNPLGDLRYYQALRGCIRDVRPDVVLGYTIKPCIWGSLAAKAEKVPSASLVTGLGLAFMPQSSPMHRLVSWVSQRLWQHATRANFVVIFQNPDDRADFIAAGALSDTSKSRLVNGSGVDMNHYVPSTLPAAANFLMIARLLGNKGVREYCEAAAQLHEEGENARFELAGFFDASLDAVSEEEIAAWKARGLVFLGELEDVRPALSGCSVYVLPSYREGTPRTVLEAMATGRAVVTTDAPGCRETVIDGVTGFIVPVADVAETKSAMKRLIHDTTLRSSMGQEGREYCKEKFAVERVNRDMLTHLGL